MAFRHTEPLSVGPVDDLIGPTHFGEPAELTGFGSLGTLKWMTADEQAGLAPCPCGEDHGDAMSGKFSGADI